MFIELVDAGVPVDPQNLKTVGREHAQIADPDAENDDAQEESSNEMPSLLYHEDYLGKRTYYPYRRQSKRSTVGCLLHLSNTTRPDISYAAGFLSRYIHEPSKELWNSAKHVLRNLKGYNVPRDRVQKRLLNKTI